MPSPKSIRAGRASVEIFADSSALTRGLNAASKRLKAFGDRVRNIGASIAKVGAIGAAPLAGATRIYTKMGDQLDKMAARTGVTVQALSELGFAAELSGSDIGTLENGVRVMQKTINDAERGLSTAKDGLQELGLTAEELRNLTPEEQFLMMSDRLSKIGDDSKRAAVAMMVFGRSGTQLLPMVANGAAGIEEMRNRARELGITMSGPTAKRAAALTDALGSLWRQIKAVAVAVADSFAAELTRAIDAMGKALRWVIDFIKNNKQLVATIAKVTVAVLGIGTALTGLGITISLIGAAVGGFAIALKAVGAVMAAVLSPIGLVVAAIGGLTAWFVTSTETGQKFVSKIGAAFGKLGEFIGKVWGGIKDAIAAGDLALAGEIAVTGLKVAFTTGLNQLREVWFKFYGFFQQGWVKLKFAAVSAMNDAWSLIQRGWVETASFFQSSWASISNQWQRTSNNLTNFFTKAVNRIRGVFDDTFDVDFANQYSDQLTETLNNQVNEQTEKKLAELDKARQQKVKDIQDEQQNVLEEIGRQQTKQLDDIVKAGADALKNDVEKLAELNKKLQEMQKEAAKKRVDAAELDQINGIDAPRDGQKLLSEIDNYSNETAKKLQSIGSFNGALIQRIVGGAGNLQKRTTDATEKTARNTDLIAQHLRSGKGLRFT
jgi:hypothetical protein